MESLLVVVAAVSLALAAIMSTVAWRLLRDSHHRTNSRAEALTVLLHASESSGHKAVEQPAAPPSTVSSQSGLPVEPEAPPVVKPRAVPAVIDAPLHDAPVRPGRGEAEQTWDRALRPAGLDEPAPIETSVGRGFRPGDPVSTAAMFESDQPGQMSLGRWLALAAAGLVILIGAGTVYALNSGTWLTSVTGGGDREDMIAATARQPLELLSLKHGTDEGGAFVITGLVQNPPDGATLRGVVAMVYLFDQQGRYFASGRARLDVSTLGAGEESPFVVKIPNASAVGRYRVGFRLDDGGVVAHVDRRGQTPAGTSGDTIDDERGPSVATPAATPRRSEG